MFCFVDYQIPNLKSFATIVWGKSEGSVFLKPCDMPVNERKKGTQKRALKLLLSDIQLTDKFTVFLNIIFL